MKNLMKCFVAAAAVFLPAVGRAAAYRSIVVQRVDGTEVTVNGEKGLTLVFTDDEMRFTTPTSQYMAFALSDVKGWRFSAQKGDTQWSGIDDAESDSSVKVDYSSNSIVLSGLPAGSIVALNALNGVLLYRAEASAELTVDLSGLPAGLYLLTYNDTTLKIAVGK